MERKFRLTAEERRWFTDEVLERYRLLVRHAEVPADLRRLSSRGIIMRRATGMGARAFIAMLHEKLNCTEATEYRYRRWFYVPMEKPMKATTEQPFEPVADEQNTQTNETHEESTMENTTTAKDSRYNDLDLETIKRLAESEINLNNARAESLAADARASDDRKWSRRLGVIGTLTGAAAMGAVAFYYVKQAGVFDSVATETAE